MATIGKATIQADYEGLVTLQCDRCKSRFKVECETLNDEQDEDICCPICGISDTQNTFYPEEVVAAAERVAVMEFEKVFDQMLMGLKSKHIKVKAIH